MHGSGDPETVARTVATTKFLEDVQHAPWGTSFQRRSPFS